MTSISDTLQVLKYEVPTKERDAIVRSAAQSVGDKDKTIRRMARPLVSNIRNLGIVGALELLAAIGWKADELAEEKDSKSVTSSFLLT